MPDASGPHDQSGPLTVERPLPSPLVINTTPQSASGGQWGVDVQATEVPSNFGLYLATGNLQADANSPATLVVVDGEDQWAEWMENDQALFQTAPAGLSVPVSLLLPAGWFVVVISEQGNARLTLTPLT